MSSDIALKVTFYPMVGSVTEQFDNLLRTLRWLDTNKSTPHDVYEWLRTTFKLSHYFARNIYTVVLISSGLVSVLNGQCYLTHEGRVTLDTASPAILLNVFERHFVGMATLLEVLRVHNNVEVETLQHIWFETVKDRFPRIRNWSKGTLSGQCGHRINWLRALGSINIVRRRCSLTESGWQFVVTYPPEAIALQPHEIKREERQLRESVLRDFQPFDPLAEKVHFLRKSFARGRAFRKIVTAQYNYCCAICGLRLETPHSTYEAEAAHIIPKRLRGSDDPRNGICLCRTHHWAFDEGIVSVRAEDFTIMVASYLEKARSDESALRILEHSGRHIRTVTSREYMPSVEALAWHNNQIFLMSRPDE